MLLAARAHGRTIPATSTHPKHQRHPSLFTSARMVVSHATLERVATSDDARPPLPTSGASAVTLGDQVLALCGYEEASGATTPGAPPARRATNAALAFTGGKWRPLPFPPGQELPAPRLAAGAVELGGRAYLIGGWAAGGPAQGADAFLSDVWRLSPPSPSPSPSPSSTSSSAAEWAWQRLELAPGSLEALGGGGVSRFAAAAVSPTRALLHTHRCADHVVALDVASPSAGAARLSRLAVAPDPQHGAPPSRGLQSMTLVGDGRLLVYGGAPQKGGMLGDLWALEGDFGAAAADAGGGAGAAAAAAPLRWTRLWPAAGGEEAGGAGDAAPHVRCSHVACAVDGGLFVLGGSYYSDQGSLVPLDDAWWFGGGGAQGQQGGPRWHRVELEAAGGNGGGQQAPPPAARNAAILAPLPADADADAAPPRRFLYHGGWRPFAQTYDDTWIVGF